MSAGNDTMASGDGSKYLLQPLSRHLSELYDENVAAKILQVAVRGLNGNVRITPALQSVIQATDAK